VAKVSPKRIITAAITGAIHVPSQTPYLPITPDQIAEEAVRAHAAGAAVAHIHVRDPQTGRPTSNLELFREVVSKVKARCDMLLCITTGGGIGMSLEERIQVVPALQPEMASFNMGSLNFALYPLASKIKEFKFDWEKPMLEMTEDLVFANTFKALKYFCQTMNQYQTKPEVEIYDVGMVNNAAHLLELGILKRPVYLQFVMGILGGIPATVENLVFLLETARRQIGEFTWSVCAAGQHQMPMGTAALLLGGNVRVGLEDSVYLSKGVLAKSNAEQVEKIVRIARELGLEAASPAEAREILGISRQRGDS
jgi:uncharacterized protein (DUF849 family)